MPKGIIRVPEGATLSSELVSALGRRFPDSVFEPYTLIPNYQGSYAKRVDILHRAFEFLLDAYPPLKHPLLTKETLKAYIDACKAVYDGTSNSVDTLQKELKRFTGKIIDTISLAWSQSCSDAAELLNEAEQYVIMIQGRGHLATLTPMDFGREGEYILQADESLPPYYDEIIRELIQIKALNYPKTPAWFFALVQAKDYFMQAYFCNLGIGITDLTKDFDDFLALWSDIKIKTPGIAHDLEHILQQSLPQPPWFAKLPLHHQEMIRALTVCSISTLDAKFSQFRVMLARNEYKETLGQITEIPQWYWVLPLHQQYFLEHALKKKDRVEDVVSFLSSRHRTLPMPPNFAAHSLSVVSSTGDFRELYSPKYRSSHIATRDGIDLSWPEAVLRRHVYSNLFKVMEKAKASQLTFLQTLVSPIGSDHLPLSALSVLIPDFKLDQMAHAAVAMKKSDLAIIQINHPFNKARFLLYTTADSPDVIAFLAAVRPYLSSVPALDELMKHYDEVLNSHIGSATVYDCVGRELFLSSLEQVIVATIGGYSYGSCVSGKDRKAIELMHTDAFYLYKEKFSSWPRFADSPVNRAQFVSLVAALYMTRHHHEHAGQNAPGSEGIKTPSGYFPEDIVAKINEKFDSTLILDCDNRLATNNEVSKISTGSSYGYLGISAEDILLCKLVSRQLGEAKCTELYDALYLVFSNMSQFIPEDSGKGWSVPFFYNKHRVPKGIEKIKELMRSPASGENNVARFATICEIILARPESDPSRTRATTSVYKLRQLLKAERPDLSLDEVVRKLIQEWKEQFSPAALIPRGLT